MAELADAPDLGSGGNTVQVQVLSPAPKMKGKKDLWLTKPVSMRLSRAFTLKSGSPFFIDLFGFKLHTDEA